MVPPIRLLHRACQAMRACAYAAAPDIACMCGLSEGHGRCMGRALPREYSRRVKSTVIVSPLLPPSYPPAYTAYGYSFEQVKGFPLDGQWNSVRRLRELLTPLAAQPPRTRMAGIRSPNPCSLIGAQLCVAYAVFLTDRITHPVVFSCGSLPFENLL